LRISPAGFDLIVDSHARLVRTTRTLLPYGVALHVALQLASGMEMTALLAATRQFPRYALGGGRGASTIFVGGPGILALLADKLMIGAVDPFATGERLRKTDLYLIALDLMLKADTEELLSAYSRVATQTSQGGG
jgi:hypothetical protein